jgi:hypothetical protein
VGVAITLTVPLYTTSLTPLPENVTVYASFAMSGAAVAVRVIVTAVTPAANAPGENDATTPVGNPAATGVTTPANPPLRVNENSTVLVPV